MVLEIFTVLANKPAFFNASIMSHFTYRRVDGLEGRRLGRARHGGWGQARRASTWSGMRHQLHSGLQRRVEGRGRGQLVGQSGQGGHGGRHGGLHGHLGSQVHLGQRLGRRGLVDNQLLLSQLQC